MLKKNHWIINSKKVSVMVCKSYLFKKKKKNRGRTPRYGKRAITIHQWLLRKLKIFQCIFHNIALGFSVIVSLISALVVCILAGTQGHSWCRWPPGHPWKIIIFLDEWKKKKTPKYKHWSGKRKGWNCMGHHSHF